MKVVHIVGEGMGISRAYLQDGNSILFSRDGGAIVLRTNDNEVLYRPYNRHDLEYRAYLWKLVDEFEKTRR